MIHLAPMGALGDPKPWVPFMDTKDCSQGFCSFYCPQWCYIILPPPPPIESPEDSSGSIFSPLVIAIIGLLASVFLLVSYYVIISKYCGNRDSARRRRENRVEELGESDDDPSNHEPWHVATAGLDEALIKSITVFKYKKDDGLIEGTDCSVCLSEFKEDESLRLLPKCTHAFHVLCIDTWLKSHSSCPLCRANIVFVSSSPLPLPTVAEPRSNGESLSDSSSSSTNDNSAAAGGDLEMGYREVEEEEEILQPSNAGPKTPRRALSDLGNPEGGDALVEIRNLEEGTGQEIRRSVSMDCRFSIADVLRLKQEDEDYFQGGDVVGSSKRAVSGMTSKSSCQRSCRVLHCVTSPVAMKRSFSSGRFSFSRRGRGRNTVIPL